jgi:hypothetical protein
LRLSPQGPENLGFTARVALAMAVSRGVRNERRPAVHVLRVIGGGTVTKVLYRLCTAVKVAVVSERVTNPGPRLGGPSFPPKPGRQAKGPPGCPGGPRVSSDQWPARGRTA